MAEKEKMDRFQPVTSPDLRLTEKLQKELKWHLARMIPATFKEREHAEKEKWQKIPTGETFGGCQCCQTSCSHLTGPWLHSLFVVFISLYDSLVVH